LKTILFLSFAAALVLIAAFTTVSKRVAHPSEARASRITSYHALYYGLLAHSGSPARLLERLGLPPESEKFIGKHAWGDDRQKFIAAEANINLKTFLKACLIEPSAYAASIWDNAKVLGNFNFGLGMVYGANKALPPKIITSLTSGFMPSGDILLGLTIFFGLLAIIFPYGASPEQRFASRVFAVMLSAILFSDIVLSTFDGKYDVYKHIIIADIASVMLIIHGAASFVLLLQIRLNSTRGDRLQS
jgi:hypothetical protein